MKCWGFIDNTACGYYRMKLPYDVLAEHGHDMKYHFGWSEECYEYPIIVGQRVGSVESMPYWRRLRAEHRLVYELDDDLWTVDPVNIRAFFGYTEGAKDHIEEAIRVAHRVTATTEPLAQRLRQFNPDVTIVPNYVHEGILDIERVRRERVTVGWAGGDSHLRDIASIVVLLRDFLTRNPRVGFHMVGTDYIGPLKLRGRFTPWKAEPFDYYRVIDFDVGIIPLADVEFNRAKSHIKALEFAALGIPVIATDMEPYREFIVDGVTGFLVRTKEQWQDRLRDLVEDESMRVEMGRKAKEIASQWTIQKHWQEWESALSSA